MLHETEDSTFVKSSARLMRSTVPGSLALFLAAGIVMLAIIDRSYPLPFMPVSWYTNRPLWYLVALLLFLSGVAILWQHRVPEESKSETEAAPIPVSCFQRVVFYTRSSCPLCEEAKTVLNEFRDFLPPVEEIDIDTNPSLQKQFNTCVPVVEVDGRVRFRGRVNRILLRRLIEATSSRRVSPSPSPEMTAEKTTSETGESAA